MSDSLSHFPAIISAVNGPTALIGLLALLIFGMAIVMFGKEGTKVKVFIFVSLLLLMVFAILASVQYESEKDWLNGNIQQQATETAIEQPLKSSPEKTTNQPIAQTGPTGFSAGTIVQQCGCWGYVELGATDLVPSCTSGYGQAFACSGFCPAGGSQWGIQCL